MNTEDPKQQSNQPANQPLTAGTVIAVIFKILFFGIIGIVVLAALVFGLCMMILG